MYIYRKYPFVRVFRFAPTARITFPYCNGIVMTR